MNLQIFDPNMKLADFEVTNLERLAPDNLVWRVHYKAALTVGDMTESTTGFVGLFSKDSSDPTFVPYEQITKEVAHQWLMERLNSGDVYRISQELHNRLAPVQEELEIVVGTPWQNQN
jgi:hypothetical protein